jgi:DNA-binding NarL/FixJ family response regulator
VILYYDKNYFNTQLWKLTNNTLRTIHKNNLLNNIKNILDKELKSSAINKQHLIDLVGHINDSFMFDKEWKHFYSLFNRIHPSFISELNTSFPRLSESDIKLCALIRLKFSSQHIATLLGISLGSVKVARHRLRKKLNMEESDDIYDFLKQL